MYLFRRSGLHFGVGFFTITKANFVKYGLTQPEGCGKSSKEDFFWLQVHHIVITLWDIDHTHCNINIRQNKHYGDRKVKIAWKTNVLD